MTFVMVFAKITVVIAFIENDSLKKKEALKSESKRRYIRVVEVLLTGNLERLLPSSNIWMFRVFIADDADCTSEELLFDITASFLEYVGGHIGIHSV